MKCPFCKKDISDKAVRCKYCRNSFRLLEYARREPCPWNLSDIIFFYMLAFILSVGFYFVLGLFLSEIEDKFILLLLNISQGYVIAIFTIGAVYNYFSRHYDVPLVEALKFNAVSNKLFFILVLAGFLLAVLGHLAPLVLDLSRAEGSISIFISMLPIGVYTFYILVLGPLYEEILFRGLLYPAINKKWGMEAAIFLTTVLFAAMHLFSRTSAIDTFAWFVILSVFLTLIRAKSQSTTASFVAHVSYNLTLILFGFFRR